MTEMTADEAIEEALRDLEWGSDRYQEKVALFRRSLGAAGFVVAPATLARWHPLPRDLKALPPGWYAILYSWEPHEGVFPGAAHWNGVAWSKDLPTVQISGRDFADEASANKWADDNDPDFLGGHR